MVYHHALACISSAFYEHISQKASISSAGGCILLSQWWYAKRSALMICNSLRNWWYTRLWRDLLSCIFVLRAQLSSSNRDCFFISQELKRARTFIDTSLTLSVCCANRLLICYSLVGHNEWRNVSGCRWFSPVTVVCRDLSPWYARLCSLALGGLRIVKTVINCFSSLTQQGEPEKSTCERLLLIRKLDISCRGRRPRRPVKTKIWSAETKR